MLPLKQQTKKKKKLKTSKNEMNIRCVMSVVHLYTHYIHHCVNVRMYKMSVQIRPCGLIYTYTPIYLQIHSGTSRLTKRQHTYVCINKYKFQATCGYFTYIKIQNA